MRSSDTERDVAQSGADVFCRQLRAALVESETDVPRFGEVVVRVQDAHIVLVEVKKKIKTSVHV